MGALPRIRPKNPLGQGVSHLLLSGLRVGRGCPTLNPPREEEKNLQLFIFGQLFISSVYFGFKKRDSKRALPHPELNTTHYHP